MCQAFFILYIYNAYKYIYNMYNADIWLYKWARKFDLMTFLLP